MNFRNQQAINFRINNINRMINNKTFYRLTQSKKSSHLSPFKEKTDKKQSRAKIKTILKLPSVKNWCSLEGKNYQLGQQIGQGAFAKVFVAKRLTDGLKCVIKFVQKAKISTQQRKKAFKRQMETLSLPKHRNIISLIDQFETQEAFGIVMEYFSNQSAAQYIKNNRPLDNSMLQKITKQICQGLLYLHNHGISHRDIKPENLLINQHGQLKIIDFGFATNSELNEVVIAGTPQYMAPQLITRKNYDPLKADIWAIGIMLYWMALGYFPQEADNKKKIKNLSLKKFQEFTLHFPIDINPGLQYLLRKMLNPNPKQRIELENILQDTWVKPKQLKDEIKRLRQSKNFNSSITALS